MTRSRDEIELDLPFHVNGTVDPATRADIDAWLAEDALLNAEQTALAEIRAAMQAEDIRSPSDFGLARLMRDIDRAAPALPATGTVAAAPRRAWVWQAVAAVAVAGFVAQAFWPRPADTPAPGGYQMASATMPGALGVSFAADAPESAIRDLLLSQGLEIVAGPSAMGFYRLDRVDGGDLNAAADALRAAEPVVESVENAQH